AWRGALFEHELVTFLVLGYGDRGHAVEARAAEAVGGVAGRAHEARQRQVRQGIRDDVRTDLLDPKIRRDELGFGGHVDPVEAGPADRRAGDTQVHLARAGFAQQPDDLPGRVATNDRVVDDHEPLAVDRALQRVELEPDAELADRLRRLDERASDVAVLYDAFPVGDTRRLREAGRGDRAGVGDPDRQVGVGRRLPREVAPHPGA